MLDTFSKVGAVAISHLKAALRKKTPYKKLLEQALARLEKEHPAPAKTARRQREAPSDRGWGRVAGRCATTS